MDYGCCLCSLIINILVNPVTWFLPQPTDAILISLLENPQMLPYTLILANPYCINIIYEMFLNCSFDKSMLYTSDRLDLELCCLPAQSSQSMSLLSGRADTAGNLTQLDRLGTRNTRKRLHTGTTFCNTFSLAWVSL